MISRRENTAATLAKTRDALAIGAAQSVSDINSEEPELVEVSLVEHTQDNVVAGVVNLSIAGRDFVDRSSLFVFYRREMIAQQ